RKAVTLGEDVERLERTHDGDYLHLTNSARHQHEQAHGDALRDDQEEVAEEIKFRQLEIALVNAKLRLHRYQNQHTDGRKLDAATLAAFVDLEMHIRELEAQIDAGPPDHLGRRSAAKLTQLGNRTERLERDHDQAYLPLIHSARQQRNINDVQELESDAEATDAEMEFVRLQMAVLNAKLELHGLQKQHPDAHKRSVAERHKLYDSGDENFNLSHAVHSLGTRVSLSHRQRLHYGMAATRAW
ncbi:hypothetical protein JCM10207_008731, partial [Rhodosporidiobolus poonsookiae]